MRLTLLESLLHSVTPAPRSPPNRPGGLLFRRGLFINRRGGTLCAVLNESDPEQSHNQNDRPSKKDDGPVPWPIPRADRAVAARHCSDDRHPAHNYRNKPGSEAPAGMVGHTVGGCNYLEYRYEVSAWGWPLAVRVFLPAALDFG